MTSLVNRSQDPSFGYKGTMQLILSLILAEVRVFFRQPVMVALALLLPLGLTAITALAEISDNPVAWASIAGRNTVAIQCITVYFVTLNTVTARRHTLALKRLRTTALPSLGIVGGLLVPPLLIGTFQICVVLTALVMLGAPIPQNLLLVVVSGVLGMVIAALAGVVTSGFTSTPEKAQWTMLPLFVATMGATAILPSLQQGLASLAAQMVPLVANAHLTTVGWHSLETLDAGSIFFDLALMLAWITILSAMSWRTFRWERRR